MEITFGSFGKVEVSWKIATFSTVAGLALYYCEWLTFFAPRFSVFCIQNPDFGFWIEAGIPILMAGVIGYIGFKEPIVYWLLFMFPSWIVRFNLIIESGSNLYPFVIVIDFIQHVILTGIILFFVARFRRRKILKKQ